MILGSDLLVHSIGMPTWSRQSLRHSLCVDVLKSDSTYDYINYYCIVFDMNILVMALVMPLVMALVMAYW